MLGLTAGGFGPRDHPQQRIMTLVDSVLWQVSPMLNQVYAAGPRFRPSTCSRRAC